MNEPQVLACIDGVTEVANRLVGVMKFEMAIHIGNVCATTTDKHDGNHRQY